MILYGYINESGYLRTKTLEKYKKVYRDADGELHSRIVTIEEQAETLSKGGWKPVDDINQSKMKADDGYIVRIVPYDAGERISFRYETVEDKKKIKKEIETLKASISSTDYKVIKCYEAVLIGEKLPYDIAVLHNERQEIRNRINELQSKL